MQMGSDRLGRVGDVAQVGLVILVQRGRHTNDDGVHLRQPGKVRSGFESALAGLPNSAGKDADNVGAALRQSSYLALIDIETRDPEFLLRIKQGKRQADIAEADN